MRRLVSSLHFILKPPDMLSYSAKAAWMSFVFNSFGKPVRKRIRVTQAERPESAAAMIAKDSGRAKRERLV